ncbi:MAG TPA: tetratricopeptide repeat protein [Verrucomicrobiae bacterium]|nr:tetratricopeptide repeat protein [Verrucomicrobiae bacterium]
MTKSPHRRNLLICSSLAAITAAVYWPVLRFGFVNYDDPLYFTENLHLRWGLTLRGLGWAFTTPLDQWMPVTWLARILEYQFFGLHAGPDHLVNLLFHIANIMLLFAVFNRMTGAPWRSAMVAALFALHPLHVESVAWVTGLKDVLSMWLGMLTIWAYVRYVEQITLHGSRVKVFYGLTLVFFVLALMSKPMVVTLPFVLLLLDYWPLGRTRWAEPATGGCVKVSPVELLKEKVPFLVLTAASCAVTLWSQRNEGALEGVPLGRVAIALLSYVGYLAKAFWPTRLAVFYPLAPNLSLATAIVAGAGLAGVTAVVIRSARHAPWLAMGWFWYLGTLVPVIGLVQVGIVQGIADRYTYVPFVGLFVMLCWSVPGSALERGIAKAAVCVIATAALAVCALLTRVQVGYWRDGETLFRHALDVTRDNWVAHNDLGTALLALGRVPEAMEHWQEALRIKPGSPETHYNLGNALLKAGKLEEAIGHYEQALRVKPDYAEAHYNLGVALSQRGRFLEAINHYEQALRLMPDLAEAHYNLGLALAKLGRVPEAIGHFEEALQLKPDLAEAHYNLGLALAKSGRVPEAIKHWEQALRLKPDYAEAHGNLGVALARAGRVREAIEHYEEALRIKPDYAEAQYNLGIALERLGRVGEAITHYEQAVRLNPDYARAHYNLGTALEEAGRVQEAIGHYREALRIDPRMVEARNRLARLGAAQ